MDIWKILSIRVQMWRISIESIVQNQIKENEYRLMDFDSLISLFLTLKISIPSILKVVVYWCRPLWEERLPLRTVSLVYRSLDSHDQVERGGEECFVDQGECIIE